MGKSTVKSPTINNPAANPGSPSPRSASARSQVEDFHDPYLVDEHYSDGTVCGGCGAVYHHQHWKLDTPRRDLMVSAGVAHEVVCPGCRKISDRNPSGIVTLRGDYWPQHREDILNLIRNEEARGVQTNPLERVMEIRDDNDTLVIETTNEKLAQRIGRCIHKAHKGAVEYQWPDTKRLLRVEWVRNL